MSDRNFMRGRSAQPEATTDFAWRRWFAQLRVVALLGLLSVVSGCTSFFYNRIDNFAAGYIEDLVTLNGGQSDQLRRWLDETLEWHRRSELQRYREFLSQLREQATQAQPASTYEEHAVRMQGFFRDLANRSAPEAARLLCTLDRTQADEFIANLHEEDAEDRQEFEETRPEELQRERVKRLQKQARRWLGKLSDEQKTLIERSAMQMSSLHAQYESRATWRRALRAQLAQTPEGCRAQAEVERLLTGPDRFWTESYARGMHANRRLTIEMITALDASLTNAQREHLRKELSGWIRMLDSLLEQKS